MKLPDQPEDYDAWRRSREVDPIEEGEVFEHWIETRQISEAELHRRINRRRSYIQQRRSLYKAAPELQAAFRAKHITFTEARKICYGSGDHAIQGQATQFVAQRRAAGKPLKEDQVAMYTRGLAARTG